MFWIYLILGIGIVIFILSYIIEFIFSKIGRKDKNDWIFFTRFCMWFGTFHFMFNCEYFENMEW